MATHQPALILFALLPIAAQAQTLQWHTSLNMDVPNTGTFPSMALAVDSEDEAAVFGITGDITIGNSQRLGDLAWRVFDANGQPLASVDFPATAAVENMVAKDGSFFATGPYKDSLRFPGHGLLSTMGLSDPIGYFICRMEVDGTVTWVKDASTLGLGGDEALAVGPTGTLFLAAGDLENSIVAQVDEDGNLLGSWPLTGVGRVSDIAVNAVGSVAVAGSCLQTSVDFNGTIVSNPFDYTVFMARFNSVGALQDHLIVHDITCSRPRVVLDDLGNAYFSSDPNIPAEVGPFTISTPSWVYGEFLVRMDPAGTINWLNEPVAGASLGDAARAFGREIALHPDGGVWQGGFTRDNVDWGNGVTTDADIPGMRLYFRHVDLAGNTQQMVTGDVSAYEQTVYGLATAGSGALYMLGYAYDTLNLGGLSFPAQGYTLFLTRWEAGSTAVTDIAPHPQLGVFPTPALDQLTIDLSGSSGMVEVELIDAMGRMVCDRHVAASGRMSMDLTGLAAGNYLVRAVDTRQALTARMVKE